MQTFYGSIFIKKEKLQEAGINHPIKLEYYKIINEDEFINCEKSKYGLKIVKTEYTEKEVEVENKMIKYLSSNEEKVNNILELLKKNEVTPIGVQDVIYDLVKSRQYF